MNVSIIICTRNRAQSLQKTLRAILDSGAADADCELLLIDNGSVDNTAQVVAQTWPDLERARYFFEPRPGKGFAYNHALRVSRGNVLLFTDDDVRPPVDWVQNMSHSILEGRTDALQGGVRISDSVLKPWMQRRHRQMLASTEYLDAANPEGLIGANMAIARNVFDQIPAFDVELGPGALGFGDETLLGMQIRYASMRITADLGCVVEHCPDVSRLNGRAWVDRAARQGRSEAYIAHHWLHETGAPISHRHRLGQLYWAARNGTRSVIGVAPCDAELQFVVQHAFQVEMLKLRSVPRNYHRCGLVKILGEVDSSAASDRVSVSSFTSGPPAQ